ncbi:MAG: hypothetical protein LWW87_03770 [Geobacteraceae bacterium]|nr:hypothetical protein [Geobacteraceae bacterium]
MTRLLTRLATILLISHTAVAADKVVSCTITTGSKTAYNGHCLFIPDAGGSFSLSSTKRQGPLFDDIGVLSVSIIAKGKAEVRGLTGDGINSRWGEAQRSTKDSACWEGSDFRICARQNVQQALKPGSYTTDQGWGNLTISRNKNGALTFQIFAIGANAHTCDLNGTITNNKAILEAQEKDQPCIVSFSPKGNDITVSDNDGACRYYCGARAGFTGTYHLPPPACTNQAVKKNRTEFKQLYDRKAYSQARTKLEPLLKNCSYLLHWTEEEWIRNDLALAQYKTGDAAACLQTLQPLAEDAAKTDAELRDNYPPSDADVKVPIIAAARTNLNLCKKAAAKAR